MKLTWPHVAIVVAVLATITVLSVQGQDTSAILTLATLLFIGLGLVVGNQQAQRDQSNGTMHDIQQAQAQQSSRMLTVMEGMAKQLAEAIPPKVINGTALSIVVDEKGKENDAIRNS